MKRDDPEGPNEADLPDTGAASTPGRPGTDWNDLPALPSGREVCYPGSDAAYDVCIPTVEHSHEWGGSYAYPAPLDGDPQYTAPSRYIDLSAPEAGPLLQLAANFQLNELMEEYKGRFALFQVHAVESLQLMRDAVGGPLYVNSAYRNVDYNAGVGGATWSRHLYGDAVDIRSDDASLDELAELCDDLGAGYTDVYTSHVHCDWRDTPLDASFYDAPTAVSHAHPTVEAHILASGNSLTIVWSGFDEGTPMIRWRGLSAAGEPVAEHHGADWTPPADVRLVEVDVGRNLRLSHRLR